MGRGDIRTKRGKISNGSFGKKRIARRSKKVALNLANKKAMAEAETASESAE